MLGSVRPCKPDGALHVVLSCSACSGPLAHDADCSLGIVLSSSGHTRLLRCWRHLVSHGGDEVLSLANQRSYGAGIGWCPSMFGQSSARQRVAAEAALKELKAFAGQTAVCRSALACFAVHSQSGMRT